MRFRCFVGVFSSLLMLGGLASAQMVKIDSGKVEGAATADGKVVAFKGIPFAAPPVGALRWKEPQPVAKWEGVRDATRFGSRCVQFSTARDMTFHDTGASEDCLTLNVWAPAGAKPGSLPVMVWIFGGGFAMGGTSEHRQDGQFLAHRDVVVVSMNYRLGIFGFFAHPELTAESPHKASGNYGLMDQAAAIAWVKRNIAPFGGDPKNITIFGESAGSFSVSALMASPVSKGLIAKAIGESGAAFSSEGLNFPPLHQAEATDKAFAEAAFGTSSLAALRELSTDDVIKGAMAKGAPRFGPDIDGYFLPDTLPHLYAAGLQAHVPLLAGWNADESRSGVIHAKVKPTAESFAAEAKARYGADAPEFLAAYTATTDEEALRSAGDYAGDRFIAYSTWRWLEAQVETGGAPVYRYFFALGAPIDDIHPAGTGAYHSDDIEYVFGALDSRPGVQLRAEDRMLSDEMGRYWTNFARTGDPNGPGLPEWPTYGPKGGWQVMHLDAHTEAKPDALRGRYVFLETHTSAPPRP